LLYDVWALTVFDDGSGAALYAGGRFVMPGDARENDGVAKWDGDTWSVVGPGFASFETVEALAVFDDGVGPALYAGGFPSLMMKFQGDHWVFFGGGVPPHESEVRALQVFDDGSGAALYAGGTFGAAGMSSGNGIARWNGAVWSAPGGGLGSSSDEVNAFALFDDGSGSALYAA